MYIPLASRGDVEQVMLRPEVRPAILALMRISLATAPGELPHRDELVALNTALQYLEQKHPLDQATLTAMGDLAFGGARRPPGVAAERIPLTQVAGWSHNLADWVRQAIRGATVEHNFRIDVALQPSPIEGDDDDQFTVAIHLIQLAAHRREQEGDTVAVLALEHSVWGFAAYLGDKHKITRAGAKILSEAGTDPSQARLWYVVLTLTAAAYPTVFPDLIPSE